MPLSQGVAKTQGSDDYRRPLEGVCPEEALPRSSAETAGSHQDPIHFQVQCSCSHDCMQSQFSYLLMNNNYTIRTHVSA